MMTKDRLAAATYLRALATAIADGSEPPQAPASISLDASSGDKVLYDIVHQRVETIDGPSGNDRPALESWVVEVLDGLGPIRRKLPDEREAITHKFSVAGHEGYITVGLYSNRAPAEVFVTMSKEGSTIRGLMDTIAKLTSLLLQFGVPIDTIADKFRYQRFEPQGIATGCSEISAATSLADYVFHWLVLRFGRDEAVRAWTPESVGP